MEASDKALPALMLLSDPERPPEAVSEAGWCSCLFVGTEGAAAVEILFPALSLPMDEEEEDEDDNLELSLTGICCFTSSGGLAPGPPAPPPPAAPAAAAALASLVVLSRLRLGVPAAAAAMTESFLRDPPAARPEVLRTPGRALVDTVLGRLQAITHEARNGKQNVSLICLPQRGGGSKVDCPRGRGALRL